VIRSPRFTLAALALAAASSGSDANRSADRGITISLRTVSTLPPEALVCLGVCRIGSYADVTVWPDGEVLLLGGEHFRVTKEEAARFRQILAPLFPTDNQAIGNSPDRLSKLCPVKVQWPADKNGARSMACGYYSVGGVQNPVFDTVVKAFKAVHLNSSGYLYP